MPLDELIIVQSSIESGDPHQCSDSVDRNSILRHVFEPLVERVNGGQFKPCLAVQWAVQHDGLTWVFRLRDNVLFHNGARLKAEDLVDNLERVIDPSVGGSYGTEGVYAGYLGRAKFTALSDERFSVSTPEPMADLLDLISELFVGCGEELDKLPEEYTGTGPYRVGSRKSDELELENFRNYWGETPPVNELTWISEPKNIQRAEMVAGRDADIGSMVGLEGARLVEGTGRVESRQLASGLCVIYMLNQLEGVCRDKRIRQALNYALDMREVIRYAKRGAAEQLNGYLTPHHFGHDPDTGPYIYDPERAKKLLREAGYPDGFRLEMDIPSSMPDEAPKLADIMTNYYNQIGLEVDVRIYHDRQGYAEMVREKRIRDLCCFDSSPRSTFRVLREKIVSTFKGPWWQGYHNPEVNQSFLKATRTFDEGKRLQIYRTIYRKITEDPPWVFLYRPYFHWAVSDEAGFWFPESDGLTKIK